MMSMKIDSHDRKKVSNVLESSFNSKFNDIYSTQYELFLLLGQKNKFLLIIRSHFYSYTMFKLRLPVLTKVNKYLMHIRVIRNTRDVSIIS